MFRSSRARLCAIGLFIGLLLALVGFSMLHTRTTEAASMAPNTAIALAVRYGQQRMPAGWLTAAPTQINATLTSLGEASQMKDGRPLRPGTKLAGENGRPVWLVFLRGDITVPNQPTPPAATYHQMSVVLDAVTGELLSIGLHPPSHEIAADTLPMFVLPVGVPTVLPPAPAQPTAIPQPTRPPAPSR